MPRRTEPVATEHKGSIRVYWEGQEYYCGPWNDPASWRKFEALKEDLLRGPGGGPMTIADMALSYWKHAKVWYRLPDKTPTSEAGHVHRIIKRLLKAHANTAVDDFGPRELRAFREKLIDKGLTRKTINQDVGRIVRMFKWAAEEPIIKPELWHRLAIVRGLQPDRTEAPDRPEIQPVDWAHVRETLPFLPPPLQAATMALRLSVCARPDEILRLRPCDIDRSGPIWSYSPTCPVTGKARHKTAWRGKHRVILFGPEVQPTLQPWIDACLSSTDWLFSPAREAEAQRERRRAKRRTPIRVGQVRRRKLQPKRTAGARYNVNAFGHAIEKAVMKANAARACDSCVALGYPPPCAKCVVKKPSKPTKPKHLSRRCRECLDRTKLWCPACRANLIPHWHANQLRHLRLTELERKYGIRDAQKAAGHSSPKTTEGYVAEDKEKLLRMAMEIG